MDQRDTDRLAELFEHALTLSPDDRRRYASEACRDDPELCSELLSLLAAHDEAPGYLERLAHQLAPAALAQITAIASRPRSGVALCGEPPEEIGGSYAETQPAINGIPGHTNL
jgi:hypothetical protein